MTITLGADPEFFVRQNGRFVLAEATGVKGTKANPTALPHGGAVQVDGCALEFNIPPAETVDQFDQSIEDAVNDIRRSLDPSFEFVFRPSVTFDNDIWDKGSQDSKMLGCDPDYSAYTMNQKTPTQGAGDRPFRTAAGHIHIGFTNADPKDPRHIFDCAVLTQYLDMMLGQHAPCWDDDEERQQLYGEFGSFRPKPYGMEYRVISNVWVMQKQLRRFIFRYVQDCVDTLLQQDTKLFTYPLNKSVLNSLRMSDLYTFWAYVSQRRAAQDVKELFVEAYNSRAFLEKYYRNAMNQYVRMEMEACGFHPRRLEGDA